MDTEYEFCSLESQMPDPINADTSFDFLDREFIAKAEIFTATKDLAAKIKSFKANHREAYNKLDFAVYDDTDLGLDDGSNVLYSLIGILK